tara:strand:+ start:767 stop:964 length:198 start_codon:yes stop_codon:yes gene_type:complete
MTFEEWQKKIDDDYNTVGRDKSQITVRNYHKQGYSFNSISHRYRLVRDINNFMNEKAVERICLAP